jgi:hypothetical protein
MSRHARFPRLAALALLVAPAFALAGSGQPGAKSSPPCACQSEVKKAQLASQPSEAKQEQQRSEEQQRIWAAP